MKLDPEKYYPLQENSEFQLGDIILKVMESNFISKANTGVLCQICQKEPQEIMIYPCKHKCLGRKCVKANQISEYLACPQCFGVVHSLEFSEYKEDFKDEN